MHGEKRQMMDAAHARLACGLAGYALGVPMEEVCKATRGVRAAAFARQVAMYLTHVGFGLSLSRVATAFGRDRSTVAHACHLIEDRRDGEDFDVWIEALEDALRAAPPPVVISPDGRDAAHSVSAFRAA